MDEKLRTHNIRKLADRLDRYLGLLQDTEEEALEYLALASMLMRRLDVAAARQTP